MHAAPDAVVLHDADLDLRSAVRDRRSEGAGDAAFAREHPGVAGLLPLAGWLDLSLRTQAALTTLFGDAGRRPRRAALARAAGVLDVLEAGGSHRVWSRGHHRLMRLAYWTGVGEQLGSEAELLALLLASTTPDGPLDGLDVLHLDDLTGSAPGAPPLHARPLLVTMSGEPLGRAPLAWGGCPWRREVFLRRVTERFGTRAALVRAQRRAA